MKKRITFNTLAAALLAGALASAAAAAERDDSASERLGFKLALQCYTFHYLTLFETVDRAAALGIKYLELFPGQKIRAGSTNIVEHALRDAALSGEILKKVSDAGLKTVAYGVCWSPNEEPMTGLMLDWAGRMGIGVLVVNTAPNARLDKLCAEKGVRLALHNHPKSWPPQQVLDTCKGFGPFIGSCSDTGHWMRDGLTPADTLRKLEGRVMHLHLKDLNDFGPAAHDVAWGSGKGDVKAVMAELKRQGYTGYFAIEYERGPEDAARDLPLCVDFFDKAARELAR